MIFHRQIISGVKNLQKSVMIDPLGWYGHGGAICGPLTAGKVTKTLKIVIFDDFWRIFDPRAGISDFSHMS